MTHPYRQDFFVSWEELHRDTRILCQALLDQQTDWHGIVAITRGGLIPAAIVARELDIRLVDTVCVVSYAGREGREQTDEVRVLKQVSGDGTGLLLIDDLVDTGQTASVIRTMLPKACFATVYAKPDGRSQVDLCVREVTQDTWIRFPWDMALDFAVPLVERVRQK